MACGRFTAIFERAEPDVLWSFCDNLAMIVDLFLVKREISPLADTDKAQRVYCGIFDGPYRQARRYARGIQWDDL